MLHRGTSAVETTLRITDVYGPGTADERTVFSLKVSILEILI